MKQMAMAVMVLCVLAGGVCADVPRPPQPPPPKLVAGGQALVVMGDSPDANVHLRLPRGLAVVKPAAPAPPATLGFSARDRDIVAGIALSGAIVAAGFWLLRYRQRPVHLGKVAATTAATLLIFGCGLWHSWLDEPMPPPQPIPGAICSGRVAIDEVANGETIEVWLPKDMADKLRADAKPK